MRLAAGAALLLAACGHPDGARPAPPPSPTSGSDVAVAPPPQPVPVDAPEATQEERLAAIQKAMNELDEAVQACWAAVAVERFDIEGEIVPLIEIEKGTAKTTFTTDTVRNPKLAACATNVFAKYPWAPPLYGQAIRLTFKFRAPDGQNVIDRALVPWAGQDKTAVAVLLDENNSNNGAASMFEIAVEAGGTTGLRFAKRSELWFFLGAGEVRAGSTKWQVAAGDMVFVPSIAAREVVATSADLHAVIVAVPGGREGAARAGALPTPTPSPEAKMGAPIVLPAKAAKSYPRGGGSVAIFAEPATIKDKTLAASVVEFPAGAAIPEHQHDKETEMLYILSGSGSMTVKGVTLPVTPTSVVQIPPATKHSFTATTALRALQIYTPAGPEQRFKAKP